MTYISYNDFEKLKKYIINICIYNSNEDVCVFVRPEYFKGKKFKNIEYKRTSTRRIKKTVVKKLEKNGGKIKLITYLRKTEAKNERQAKRK